MNNKLLFSLLFSFAFIGVFSLSTFLHESYHVFSEGHPISLCMDVGRDSIAHVNYVGIDSSSEVKAYTITSVVMFCGMIGLFSLMTNLYFNNLEKRK